MTKVEAKELKKKVDMKFRRMEALITGIAEKHINGAAFAGERGLGKSYTIKKILEKYADKRNIKKVKGHISPLQVYNTLAENQDADCIVWFDDCDNAFTDPTAMNILKAAMDTDEPREVSWNSTSSKVELPEFRFRGRLIVSTNVNLAASPHLAAFLDRIHWCSVFMSQEEKLVRLEEIAQNYGDDPALNAQVLNWIKGNADRIGSLLSMRTFVKVYDLAKFMPDWADMADTMITEQLQVEQAEEEAAAEAVHQPGGDARSSYGSYKEGSMVGTVFNNFGDGKPHTEAELSKGLARDHKKKVGAIIKKLARHGKKSGLWQIIEHNNGTFSRKDLR